MKTYRIKILKWSKFKTDVKTWGGTVVSCSLSSLLNYSIVKQPNKTVILIAWNGSIGTQTPLSRFKTTKAAQEFAQKHFEDTISQALDVVNS